MESLAQKKARANFKKAIAYRKKTGCSLKEAFAYVSGKKVIAKKTVVKKRSSSPLKKKKIGAMQKEVKDYNSEKKKTIKKLPLKIEVKKTTVKKRIVKKAATKKVVKRKLTTGKKLKYAGTLPSKDGKISYRYSLGKKPTENIILNKIHKVKKDVDKLDEAQHKHMSLGGYEDDMMQKYQDNNKEIIYYETRLKNSINSLPTLDKFQKIVAKDFQSKYKKIIKELKTHNREIKKMI